MTDPQLQKPWPNDLIADKNKLVGIAQAFEQELVAQVISDKEITSSSSVVRGCQNHCCGMMGPPRPGRGLWVMGTTAFLVSGYLPSRRWSRKQPGVPARGARTAPA
jgi:hypothetical protein